MELKEFLPLLKDAVPKNNYYIAKCPVHDDNKQSLQVWEDADGYIQVKCYANCDRNNIIHKLKLSKGDLVSKKAKDKFIEENKNIPHNNNILLTQSIKNLTKNSKTNYNNINHKQNNKGNNNSQTIYNYNDKENKLLYQVIRKQNKQFYMRQMGKDGKWIYNLNGVKKILYKLPELISAVKAGKPIYIVEGEKDVDNLMKLGLIATTNIGGASSNSKDSKWLPDYNHYFDGADVIIIPDNDEPGFRHAYNIFHNIYEKVKSIKFGILESVPYNKYDSSDIINHFKVSTKEAFLSKITNITLKEFEKYLNEKGLENIYKENSLDFIPSLNIDDYAMQEGESFGYCNKTGYCVYNSNDLGNVSRVVHQFGDIIRFNNTAGKWLIWNGSKWEYDNSNKITTLITKSIYSIKLSKVIINPKGDIENDIKKIHKFYNDSSKRSSLNSIMSILKELPQLTITQNKLDSDVNQFNLLNGTFDLKKHKFCLHNPEDYLSKQVYFNYDGKATCNEWFHFLDTIFNYDQELISFIQRAVGLTLSGASLEEVFFFCYGSGKNGKSIFFNILKLLFGDYYQKADVEMILQSNNRGIPNDVAQLPGARLVVFSEIPLDRRFNESLLKDLTGNDDIQARFLHKEFFTFKPINIPWLYGNHKPIIRGSDYGIWRRIVIIPFVVTISDEQQIPSATLLEKFKLELSGIFNWAIKGLENYYKEGLKPPTKVVELNNKYKEESDLLLEFINECCEESTICNHIASKLYLAYSLYCKENGEFKLGKKIFYSKLVEKGFEKYIAPHGKTTMFKGITLKDKYKQAE